MKTGGFLSFYGFQRFCHIDLVQFKGEDKLHDQGGQQGERHANQHGQGRDFGLEPNAVDSDLGQHKYQQEPAHP